MNEQTILTDVEQLCRKTFRNPRIRVTTATTATEVDGWDSLSHAVLIHNIERHFKIKITVREAINLANVAELVSLIGRKVA